MKVYNDEGVEYKAFKLPCARDVYCEACELDIDCEYYGYSWIPGGSWEGSICLHPKAKGNKRGWLIKCPEVEAQEEID